MHHGDDHPHARVSQANECIAKGKQLFAARDRMGALAQFETATNQVRQCTDTLPFNDTMTVHSDRARRAASLTLLQRGTTLPACTRRLVTLSQHSKPYAVCCCAFLIVHHMHVTTGAIMMGLDLEDAMNDPTVLKMTASPQIIIQLKKFAAAVRKQRMEAAVPQPPSASPRPPNNTGAEKARSWRSGLDDDLSDILQTENSIDASLGGTNLSMCVLPTTSGISQLLYGVCFCWCWLAWCWGLPYFTWD